jgi:UDP-glucose 4-epimerase
MKGKILVTGGVGYIGIHTVVELVSAGYEPIIVDDLSRSDIGLLHGAEKILGRTLIFFKADCRNEGALRDVFRQHADLDGIIHFAALKSVNESVTNPLLYYQNNLSSLMTVIGVAKEFGVCKVIFSSSCTVYGQADEIPVTEETPFKKAESAYGATKQMCEEILRDVARAYSLKVISLRYFNPIGAHPSGMIGELPVGIPNNLVPYITQVAIGKREKLTIFGNDYNTPDGTCLRDFIHVVDLAKAHIKAFHKIDSMPDEFVPINVGTGEPVTVLQLVKCFIRVTAVKLNYTIGPRRPGDIERVYADTAKSRKLLDWKAELTIDDSLRDAWRWEQSLKNATH